MFYETLLGSSFQTIFISPHSLWTLTYLFPFFYFLFILSSVVFVNGNANLYLPTSNLKKKNSYSFVTGQAKVKLNLTLLVLWFLLNWVWVGSESSVWFNHVTFTSFNCKFFYLMNFKFFVFLLVFSSISFFSSQEIYDYLLTIYSFFIWLFFLYTANNVFTLVFFFELLSTLTNLLLVTSTFSSFYFYNTTNLNKLVYFQKVGPNTFLQTMIFFFWISLVTALNLFFFLLFLQIKIIAFDWFSIEAIFNYLVTVSTLKANLVISFAWINLVFSLFLKCGLVPLFLWKPTFFKGMTIFNLFFYLMVYYYLLLLYLILFLGSYVADLFYFYLTLTLSLTFLGVLYIFVVILESFYIKSFLALSSVLNTLLIILGLSSSLTTDFFLFL